MSVHHVDRLVAEIATLDLEGLRKFWGQRYGALPPLRSVPILRQLLAWRVQAAVFGGLDPATRRAIERTGRAKAEGLELGVGARLMRIWDGREVEVVVEEQGFRHGDRLFPSLSAAATEIAGSRWNGPRFFGLRKPK